MPNNTFSVHVILHEREETKVSFSAMDTNQYVSFENITDHLGNSVSNGLGILVHTLNGGNVQKASPDQNVTSSTTVSVPTSTDSYIRIFAAVYREFDIVFSNCVKLRRFYAPRHSYWDLSALEPCTNLQVIDINGHATGDTSSLRELMNLRAIHVHVTEGINVNLLDFFQNQAGVAKTSLEEIRFSHDPSNHAKYTSLVFDTSTIRNLPTAPYSNLIIFNIRGVSKNEPFWGITGEVADLQRSSNDNFSSTVLFTDMLGDIN